MLNDLRFAAGLCMLERNFNNGRESQLLFFLRQLWLLQNGILTGAGQLDSSVNFEVHPRTSSSLFGKANFDPGNGNQNMMKTGIGLMLWICASSVSIAQVARADSASSNAHPVPDSELWLTYSGHVGPGKGKHIVLIAAEQEYRSEQSLPMLARVLSMHHGFDCTVLFSVNERGEVDPTLPAPFKGEDEEKRHNIPGLEYLANADCVIWMSRFMQLSDTQMKYFHDYFDSGKPVIALRTANHGFWGRANYSLQGKSISLRELLGGTFMGHHGGWHRESTRGILVPENKMHPVLIGVSDIWGTSDVYRCHNEKHPFPQDCTALVMGQPLINLEPGAPPNAEKEPLPIAWTKTWKGNRGKSSRILHFTMGSAEDFENAGVRRVAVNGVYWGLGLEESIKPDSAVDIVGEYKPLKAGFNYDKLGVQARRAAYYK